MNDKQKSRLLKLSTISAVALLAKWSITKLNFQSVKWLMNPVKIMIEYATGLLSTTTDIGYQFPNHVLLSFECSGIHFFTICFLSFWFMLWQSMNLPQSILLAFILSYITTIIANTSRILFFMSSGSAYTEHFLNKQLNHQLLGGVIFCFWLFASSLFLNYKIKTTHEVV